LKSSPFGAARQADTPDKRKETAMSRERDREILTDLSTKFKTFTEAELWQFYLAKKNYGKVPKGNQSFAKALSCGIIDQEGNFVHPDGDPQFIDVAIEYFAAQLTDQWATMM